MSVLVPSLRGAWPLSPGVERLGAEAVPEAERHGTLRSVFAVWFTPNPTLSAFFIGSLSGAGFLRLGASTALAAIGAGNTLGAARRRPGRGRARDRTPQMQIARRVFGRAAALPALFNWAMAVGWDGVDAMLGAAALAAVCGLPLPAASSS
ncbi:MAG: cytosine permease [Chloroflexota bacterium]